MAASSIQQRKRLSAKDLDKKIEVFVEELAQETDSFRKSSFFKEYLDCMAKFWRYSYRNQLLIFSQKSSASRVAGFKTWNELGRFVKKGEKAIKILAPSTKKFVKKDLQTGEEKETEITLFFPVSVFDVSQTKGKELPRLDLEVNGSDQQELLNKLIGFCKKCGIAVEFKELGVNGLYGYSQGKKIVVGANQNINTQANTLIHEIAHELTHYPKEGCKFSKQDKEIQAEATAYVITKALGLENKSPEYLALYTNNKNKILENIEVISKTSKQILEHLNEETIKEVA